MSSNEGLRGAEQSHKDSYTASARHSSTNDHRDTLDASRTGAPSWRSLFSFTTRANIPILVIAVTCSLVASVASPAQSFITGKVFDGFISLAAGRIGVDEFMGQEQKWILYLVGISSGSWLFHSLEFSAWVCFGELQAKGARDQLFHSLSEKNIEWYDQRINGVGALLSRLQIQVRELQLATSQPLGGLLALVSTSLLSLAQAFYNSWDLTLVTLAGAPLIVFVIVYLGSGMQAAMGKQETRLTEAQKYSLDAFAAIETVKCFNGQKLEQAKYKSKILEAATCYYRVANRNALQIGFLVFLAQSMFVQAFYYGGVLISNGSKSSSEVVTTFFSAIGAFQAIQGILPQMLVLEKGRAAGTSLRTIISQAAGATSHVEELRGHKPKKCTGDIHLKNVSFHYPSRPSQPALDNVTMHIPGGQMTFLIGRSGSGKSTIGQLLLRFYSHTSGAIIFDGQYIEMLDASWLRSQITLVEQTSILFNTTLFRNIALGRTDWENVTRDEVMSAIEFALLQPMVSDMVDGLHTLVGVKGGAVSGGQRQRIDLARARIRDTPILILDESTSALDHISRGLMMDAIRQWRRSRTTIIITHDIAQIQADDYCYLLEHGEVVQEGYRKHMEKLKGSPFQGFLPHSRRKTVSPFVARDVPASKPITTQVSSLNSSVDFSGHPRDEQSPIDRRTNSHEIKRRSMLASLIGDASPVIGIRSHTGTVPTSTFTSPFLRMNVSPPAQFTRYFARSPVSGSVRTSWSLPSTRITSVRDHTEVGNDKTSDLEGLIEKTGKTAAYARLPTDGDSRRRKPRRTFSDSNEATQAGVLKATTSQSFSRILGHLWPNIPLSMRVLLVLGFWSGTVHAVASPVFSYVLSKLLGLYAEPGDHSYQSLTYAMVILAIAATDAVHTYAFRFFLEHVSQRWVDSIRFEAMRRILLQPRVFFERNENSASTMMESLDRNAEEMRNLLGRFFGMIWMAAIMVSVSITWALIVQWKMTLIVLSVGPYIFLVTNAFSTVSAKWEGLSNDASEAASSVFMEAFTNIKTMRALTLEAYFKNKYNSATNHSLKVGFQKAFFSGFFYGLSDSASNFSTALVFYVGTRLVSDGVGVMEVIQVLTMLVLTIQNVSAIFDYIPQIGSAKDTASRLLRLAQLPQYSHEFRGDTRLTSIEDIRLNDLRFSYPSRPGLQVLRGINLRIKPGTTTAIVGGSGSGKSTLANLLLKMYPTPESSAGKVGNLTVSGRDIKHVHTNMLRTLVAMVSQTPALFAASIAANITYGLSDDSPHNTVANTISAARQAGIHDFIASLPLGYGTLIGDGGMGLSGGQAQRIAIARTLVRKPSVLILDEATSALDAESAALVRQTVQSLVSDQGRKMTVIIITHSREMMEIAEHIVVLDQGRIVEGGDFEELMAKNGHLVNLLSGGEWMENEAAADPEDGGRQTPGGVQFDEEALDQK